MSALSPEALRLCAESWARQCARCPLERECSAPLPSPARMVDIDAHVEAVNAAAARLEEERCRT